MRLLRTALAAAIVAAATFFAPTAALAQSCPQFSHGAVLTAGQWQACFDAKQNALGYTPVNKAGDTMLGRLVTVAPGTVSGFNLTPGSAPSSPANGDFWATSSGFFGYSNGTTYGPFASASAAAFAATAPITVSFPAGVVTYAFDLSVANTWTATQTFRTLLAGTTNTYDVGTSATVAAFRTIYAGTSFVGPVGTFTTSVAIGGATIGSNALAVTGTAAFSSTVIAQGSVQSATANIIAAAAGAFQFSTTRSQITSSADGLIGLFNAVGTDFSRLQFGGTTSSFPALKRNTTGIDVRLADDSAYAPLVASTMTATSMFPTGAILAFGATAIPAGGTAGLGYAFSTTSNFGAFFGSGVPTLSAAQGSLYLRSDGAAATRLYVNSNGTTGWDALGAAGITALTGDVTATGPGSVAATLATAQPAVHTWALAQTFTVAPVFTDASGSRTALGLGTAATQATGTSGAALPFLNGTNTWSGTQTFGSGVLVATSASLTTPAIGAATGASVSLTGVATILNATSIPAGGTAGSGYLFSSTANFGTFFGSGAPSLSVAQGSLYLRSDGGVGTRLYVNTNGSTTYVAMADVNVTSLASLTTVGALVGGSATTGFTIAGASVTWSSQIAGANVAIAANASGSASATFGVVKCDGTTITCASGVITAIGAAASSIGVGTTTISSGTDKRFLYDNAGTLGETTAFTVNVGDLTVGVAGTTVGTLAFANATSGTIKLSPPTGALGTVTLTLPAVTATLAAKIASGAKALATSAIASAACSSAQTDTATGALTTDVIEATFNADPTAVTGYVPLTAGMLTIIAYPTADTVNFKVCNNTSASITPGAITINWRVVR